MFGDILKLLLFGLIPPDIPLSENGPPSKEEILKYRKAKELWRRAVAVSIWLILLAGSTHILWACGLLPGSSGFALAADMKKVDVLIISQLRDSLMENRRYQCEAIKDGDVKRKVTYADIMADLRAKYTEVTDGLLWEQPGCDEL